MNGYNTQLYNFDRQIQEKKNELAELEKQKIQAQFAQPAIFNQTIQAGPQPSGIRFAESIDEVKREMIFLDTLFVNRAFTNMWYKTPTGVIKTYLLEEFVPKDAKDVKIEKLENELRELKEQKNYESSSTNDSSTVKSTISPTVPTTTTDETE